DHLLRDLLAMLYGVERLVLRKAAKQYTQRARNRSRGDVIGNNGIRLADPCHSDGTVLCRGRTNATCRKYRRCRQSAQILRPAKARAFRMTKSGIAARPACTFRARSFFVRSAGDLLPC